MIIEKFHVYRKTAEIDRDYFARDANRRYRIEMSKSGKIRTSIRVRYAGSLDEALKIARAWVAEIR